MTASGQDPETWLDLEKLATRIFRDLRPDCVVQHNARVVGCLSETSRQLDVLIEDPELGTRLVVDCKDHKRPVNIVEAGAFASLLEDVEATGGVLICNRGFSKPVRNYAKKKGFRLATLHDVDSRKWQLDLLMPVVWTALALTGLHLGFKVRLEKGDELQTTTMPAVQKDGRPVDIRAFFETNWNAGQLHFGQSGQGELGAELDIVLADGSLRPDAEVRIAYDARAVTKLGYVTPQQARGIFDEEEQAFFSAHLDVGATVEQEPQGGWVDVFDIADLAVALKGTVVTLQTTQGVDVSLGGIAELRGVGPDNRHVRWTPENEWDAGKRST